MTAVAGPAIAAASAAATGAAANGTAVAARTPAAEPGHFPPALRVVPDGNIVDTAAAHASDSTRGFIGLRYRITSGRGPPAGSAVRSPASRREGPL